MIVGEHGSILFQLHPDIAAQALHNVTFHVTFERGWEGAHGRERADQTATAAGDDAQSKLPPTAAHGENTANGKRL